MNLLAEPVSIVDFVPLPTQRARCSDGQGTLSHLFFSTDDLDVARAKAICSRCEMATECLNGAMDRREVYGVWGGTLLIDGIPTRLPPRRGRPSLEPRIEFADEVPVPEHLVA